MTAPPRVDAPRRGTQLPDLVAGAALGLAAAWSVALVVLAATAHIARDTVVVAGVGSPVIWTSAPRTLVQRDGAQVELVVLLPLVAVVTTVLALGHRRRQGRAGAGATVWAVTGAVGAVSLLGALTIGPILLPVAVLLVLAAGVAEARAIDGPEGKVSPGAR
ncbi:MAG: hypothetical protein ACRDY1_12915 [Acidimicrobiales bacterium]